MRATAWAISILFATAAHATETQLWVTDAPADYAKAEARGVVVDQDGVIRLGPRAVSSPVESLSVIWALAVLEDGSVAIGGTGGRIARWTAAGGVRPWVRLPVGQVLSLARSANGLVVGTGPDGLVYRVGARGDTTLLARTGERYVWGLTPAGVGAWYAATGTRGRLVKIEGGRVRTVLDSDESNLVSIASDGRGGAYAGGDSKGRVVHARADGSIRTVFDAPEDEVRALALGPDRALYAAALSSSAVEVRAEEGDDGDRAEPVRTAPSSGKATVYRIVPDSVAHSVWVSPQPFVYALAALPAPGGARGAVSGGESGIVAATGNRAGIYHVAARGHASLWLATNEGQVTALAVGSDRTVFAATSNPGALWRIGRAKAEKGEMRSSVLDARRFARFGKVRWRGQSLAGRVEIHTRSGNTDPPDTTWSPWRMASASGQSGSPAARYLQWRLTLAGGDPRVDAVEVAWREQNLPPRVEDLVVAPQGIGFREGDLTPRSEPVTQTLPGGQKVEYSISTTPSRNLRELPAWARGLRTIQWKGSDPNGDAVRYRVHVREEAGEAWIELGEDLQATSFTWDTHALPDGRYRIRVTASDAPDNPVGEELTTETTSEPFSVDNTAPAIRELEARGEPGSALVLGRADDAHSMLSRLEVSVDDSDWRTLSPEGGLADDKVLSFRARLPDLEPGAHTVSVKVVDLAGNSAVRATKVTVPRRK